MQADADPANVTESPAPHREHDGMSEARAASNVVLLISVMLLCLIAHYFLRSSKEVRHFVPESAASMTIGLVVGGIASLVFNDENLQSLQFQPEVFFFLLLPPIVFDAGFSIKKRLFFDNIGSILLFAVVGTIISTFVVGLLTYAAAEANIIRIDASTPLQSLVFGALISSVDPVATLSIMGDPSVGVDPLLYSLVFGESVLNDAVAIVLFRAFQMEDATAAQAFGFSQVGTVMARFFLVALGSLALGACVGLLCSFSFKNAAKLREYPVMEVQLLFISAFGSFALGELLGLSGVTSLFTTGLTLSHYNFFNLSEESKISSLYVFESMAKTAETFVFISMGLSLFATSMEWDVGFIMLSILFCVVGRFLNIFPLALLANLCRERKIPRNAMILMFFSGLRGSVSFALAMQLDPNAKGVGVVQSTTLMLVIITTIFLGSTAYKVIEALDMRAGSSSSAAAADAQQQDEHEIREDFSSYMEMSSSNHGPLAHVEERRQVSKFWHRMDDRYMRPLFGGSTEANARRARRIAARGLDGDHDALASADVSQGLIARENGATTAAAAAGGGDDAAFGGRRGSGNFGNGPSPSSSSPLSTSGAGLGAPANI